MNRTYIYSGMEHTYTEEQSIHLQRNGAYINRAAEYTSTGEQS